MSNCAVALFAGLALLVGSRLKGLPFAGFSLFLGAALGMTIGLYSPGDDQAVWFVAPAALSTAAVVVFSAFLLTKIDGPWWNIARNIVGSWLVATSVLLAAFRSFRRRKQTCPQPLKRLSPRPKQALTR